MAKPIPYPDCNPSQFNFTRDVVDHWAQQDEDPVALVWNPPNTTDPSVALSLRFSHFSKSSQNVALGLRRIGINKGDVVMLLSSKTPDW